ncbi:hypothetical protein LX77_03167 [Gelidibacter algens]|uniref:Uncharacterized protein n=1 Tax=Gelidibacter algens TaxID=49280 RepID=A0A327RW28_9FLAO|nr:hypothetical protein LX77_03167 [Gelidibacter algens]
MILNQFTLSNCYAIYKHRGFTQFLVSSEIESVYYLHTYGELYTKGDTVS